MNGQPSNPQAVVYNISNTNVNIYVNATPPEATRAECPTEHADKKQARAPPSPPLDGQHNVTRFTDTSHVNLNNRTGFDQGDVAHTLDDAQSLNKETLDFLPSPNQITLLSSPKPTRIIVAYLFRKGRASECIVVPFLFC
jgi:hypothetical protein